MMKRTPTMKAAMTAIPPTTPPAMAPALLFFPGGGGVGELEVDVLLELELVREVTAVCRGFVLLADTPLVVGV
jgi:hypothetical protein